MHFQSAQTITCSMIQDLSESATTLTATELSSLSSTEFTECLDELGSLDKQWSTEQMTALVSKFKAVKFRLILKIKFLLIGFKSCMLIWRAFQAM